MSYYPFDADTDKEVSLVFLPARAAAVATTLSGLASFIALVLTAEVSLSESCWRMRADMSSRR
jgi:hypothetical protein